MSTTMITPKIVALLRNYAITDGNAIRLTCGQLERRTYEAVDDVLTRLGGKWNRRTRAHLFDRDPAPLLATVLETEELPPKNPLAFFATPPDLAARVVQLARLALDCTVLEPSAGDGALCDAVRAEWPSALIGAIEIDPVRAARLRQKGYVVWCGDFLEFTHDGTGYDRIVMNPPFTAPGDPLAYITHIQRAYTMLAPGGRLAAIAPVGFLYRSDRRSSGFRELVEQVGNWEENAEDAFVVSGAGVRTVTLWMGAER